MVCVPCIILPILLAIYVKFIQPFIIRFLPDRWVHFLDPILYPTCPVKMSPQNKTEGEEEDVHSRTTLSSEDTKKEQ